jgi:hypothetical protein
MSNTVSTGKWFLVHDGTNVIVNQFIEESINLTTLQTVEQFDTEVAMQERIVELSLIPKTEENIDIE